MDCPFCKSHDSKVIDSRDTNDVIRRRRQCAACSARFSTYEKYQPADLFVIKKDKRHEAYSRDKLMGGVRRACEKRPLPEGAVEKLVDAVEVELYRTGKSEVPSTLIGDMVMVKLKKLDNVAYIRFASVYRQFEDITDFKEAVESLADAKKEPAPLPGQLALLPEIEEKSKI